MKDKSFYSALITALLFSVLFSLIIIASSYGIFYLLNEGELLIPYQYLIILFAIYFIVFSVFVEYRGALHLYSIIGGLILSGISIFLTIAVISGIQYLVKNYLEDNPVIDLDEFTAIFGVCMAVGYVIFKILTHKRELKI
jgi:amino acid transporter